MPGRLVGERRREQRVPADDQGHLRILNPVLPETSSIQLVDRSTDGLRIESSISLSPGTLVQIRLKDALLVGEVRYCTGGLEGGFAIGIRVESLTPLKPKA